MIDLDDPWVLDPADLKSKCKNTPFDEARLQGRVVRTIVGGRTRVRIRMSFAQQRETRVDPVHLPGCAATSPWGKVQPSSRANLNRSNRNCMSFLNSPLALPDILMVFLAGYLLGSIPFGLILTQARRRR